MSEEGTPILTAGMAAQFEGGFASNDDKLTGAMRKGKVNKTTRNGGFVNGRFAEVYFDGEMTADNGLVYGAKIHMNTTDRSVETTSGYPGRQYIYLKGDWGSMEFGTGSALTPDSGLNLCPLACTYKGFGGLDTPYKSYILTPDGAINNHINPFWFNQSPKAVYYTPVINGFQAGISYTPSAAEGVDFFKQSKPPTSEIDGQQKDVIGLGSQWNGDFAVRPSGFQQSAQSAMARRTTTTTCRSARASAITS